MKVSREQVVLNRSRILATAGRLFRERGVAGVSVGEVMRAAGLTHGAFYGYFPSKEALVAEAVASAAAAAPALPRDVAAYAKHYLSESHRANRAGGCAMAALAGEVGREDGALRHVMTEALRSHLQEIEAIVPGRASARRRQSAIGTWSAMVGALVLARMSEDPELSREVLEQTRLWVRNAGRASP